MLQDDKFRIVPVDPVINRPSGLVLVKDGRPVDYAPWLRKNGHGTYDFHRVIQQYVEQHGGNNSFEWYRPKVISQTSNVVPVNECFDVLFDYVKMIVETRVREADVSDGSRVPHGSSKHIKDLETRIADLTQWRDKQRRGSEARANYARVIQRLKSELASARRAAAKKKLVKETIDEPTTSAEERWQSLSRSEDPIIKNVVALIQGADSPRALGKVKKNVEKMMDDGNVPAGVTDGFVGWLVDQRKAELQRMNYTPRPSADARIDMMARTMDSSGKKRARRMS